MPELVMERPKMSLQMHETLKKYILRERRRKKEEDVANEQKMREEIRKAEMNTQTLEQNEQQLKQLELKLDELQLKKRDLFNQLKKVLNEETNLKKNNRPVMPPIGSQYSSGPEQNNILMYNQSPGLTPSILNPLSQTPSIMSIPQSSTTPTPLPGPGPSSNPTSSTSSLIAPPPLHPTQTNSLLNNNNSANNNNKPQSPFHPPPLHLPHHLAHSTSNFPLIPTGPLKYFPPNSNGMPPSISPQLSIAAAAVAALAAAQQQSNSVNHHLNQSPSSSPAIISSSPRHQSQASMQSAALLSTPSSKRIRSPSPSSSPIHLTATHHHHSPYLYPPSVRSPSLAVNNSASPPPHLQPNQLYNSPTNNKKSRSSSLMVSIPNSNPTLNTNQSPQHRPSSGSFNQPGNNGHPPPPTSQQSAFSPFHNSIISNRSLNAFPQQQQQQSTQQSSQKANNSQPIQSYSPLPSPQSNYGMPRNMPAPPLPPTSQSPTLNSQFNSFTYLNALAQETAQKIIYQQQQSHQQQQLQQQLMQQHIMAAMQQQQHLNHMPMHPHHSNNNNSNSNIGPTPNPANSNSGGGSILTGHGFSVRSGSSNLQPPPSSY